METTHRNLAELRVTSLIFRPGTEQVTHIGHTHQPSLAVYEPGPQTDT